MALIDFVHKPSFLIQILRIKMLALQGGMELKLNVEKFIKSVEMNKNILYDF